MGGNYTGRTESMALYRRQHCSNDSRALTPAWGRELRLDNAQHFFFPGFGSFSNTLAEVF